MVPKNQQIKTDPQWHDCLWRTHEELVNTLFPRPYSAAMFYDFVCSISYQFSVHPKALLHLLIGGEGLIVLFRILPTDALPDSLAETLRGFFRTEEEMVVNTWILRGGPLSTGPASRVRIMARLTGVCTSSAN